MTENHKLKIDLLNGLIKAEGSRDIILKVYEDFKSSIGGSGAANTEQNDVLNSSGRELNLGDQQRRAFLRLQKKRAKKGKKAPSGPRLNKDLDLYDAKNGISLKSFLKEYDATSLLEYNLLFVAYLKDEKGCESVG